MSTNAYKNTKARMIRQAMNLTSEDVRRKLGVGHVLYSQVENGRLIPSGRVRKLLEDFYGLPFNELIKEIDPKAIISAIKRN